MVIRFASVPDRDSDLEIWVVLEGFLGCSILRYGVRQLPHGHPDS